MGIDIIDVEHSNELLGKIVEMWVPIRGFAVTSKLDGGIETCQKQVCEEVKGFMNLT